MANGTQTALCTIQAGTPLFLIPTFSGSAGMVVLPLPRESFLSIVQATFLVKGLGPLLCQQRPGWLLLFVPPHHCAAGVEF